jgi:Tfp pilus assembly protein FimT
MELVMVMVMASVLIGIAGKAFGSTQRRFAAEQGRMVFESMHARARGQAIESGAPVRLYVDTGADTVSLSRGAVVLETIHFADELAVDIGGASLTLCMGPRGFASDACTSFDTPQTLTFTRGENTESLRILPLGQLVR